MQATQATHSAEWFENSFQKARGKVPPLLKEFVKGFCIKYNIRGEDDPLRIANLAAQALGYGDGAGTFLSSTNMHAQRFAEQAKWLSTQLAHTYRLASPSQYCDVRKQVDANFGFKPLFASF